MANVAISGDTSGAVTLTVPATAGTQTVTFPAATGTAMVSGNMPAFSAYQSTNQTISSSTFTKVAFNTKLFDTATAYDTTNYRFTPLVAGYYQVSSQINYGGASTAATRCLVSVYKNGAEFQRLGDMVATGYNVGASCLIYCNGSTDYLELYAFITATTPVILAGAAYTYFQATLVRSA